MFARLYLILTFFLLFAVGSRPCAGQQMSVDSLSSQLKTSKADTSRVNILYKLSDALRNTKPDQAIEYANQGLSLSHKIAFKNGQSICLNALGLAYYQLAKLDTALICFEKRVEIASEINDSLGIAQAYDNIGVIYHQFGKNDEALKLRMKANCIYVNLHENNLLASGYTWIGNIYKDEGKYTLALENYLKALKIYEEQKNENDLGFPLINISSVYRFMKQYSLAKRYAIEAKSKFIKANMPKGVGVSLYRLALICNEEKDFDGSIKYLEEAKLVFKEIQDTYFLTLVNQMLGTTYRSMGENEIALKYFNDALPIALQIGDQELISAIFQNIGTVYNDKGEFLKALEYMHKSEKILFEINDKKSLREISVNFIELYSRINQPDSVVKYLKLYQQLSDTIFNEQNSKSIAEMQTKYETEKKDKEIITLNLEDQTKKNNILLLQNINEVTNLKLQNSAIENEKNTQSLILAKTEHDKQLAKIEIYKLNEENQIQAIKNEKDNKRLITLSFILGLGILSIISLLSFLNFRNRKKKEKAILNQKAAELGRLVSESDMKALRSQMNPHFIFNCIHTINGLLNELKIQESKTCLNQFSNLTRSVLENSKKKEIPLSDELETLRLYMELENMRFHNSFQYLFEIESDIDLDTTLVPPLILQPFVENSIKHGFSNPEKTGKLTIAIRTENEFLICSVEDNGVGRTNTVNIKTISGFKKESLGIKLTEERLNLISKTKNVKSHFLINDLVDGNNSPSGTLVEMYLPYELSV